MEEDKQTFSKLHGTLDIEIAIEKIEQIKKDISCRWIREGKIVIKFSSASLLNKWGQGQMRTSISS